MTKTAHKIFIIILSTIILLTIIVLARLGYGYYDTSLEERFFHADHESLKPSGLIGHGMGIIGSLLMLVGVSSYMMRKRLRKMYKLGLLKHWLEFHIFLCTLGPILVLFHTAFKFGGLVAISFWSMVAVFISGIIGRFIYIQIPRTIEGRELSLHEIREMQGDLGTRIRLLYDLNAESYKAIMETAGKKTSGRESNLIQTYLINYREDRQSIRKVKSILKRDKLKRREYQHILRLVREEVSMNRRIERLVLMQNLFKYWHVAHLPFALVMLIIMLIHVGVTLTFGYRWIF